MLCVPWWLRAAEEQEPQGLAALLPGRQREKRVNIRERMASILSQVCVCMSASGRRVVGGEGR